MFSVRLPKDIEEKLNAISKKTGVTKSEIVKSLLRKFIEEQEKDMYAKAVTTLKEAVQLYTQEKEDLNLGEIYRRRHKVRG